MATDSPDPSEEERPAAPSTDADAGATNTDVLPHPAFEPYAAESLPAAAVGSPGKDGRLDLTFAVDAEGDTHLTRDLARTPFHVSGTLGHDPAPRAESVYVQSPSGGVVQGDRHDISVSVGPDALASVTTASATKVLSMERNYAAADVSLSVGAGGHLDYVPAPTILHADARFGEDIAVDLAPDATAIVGSVVVPGRLARGERFDFDRYAAAFEARADGDLLVADATHLAPAESDPTATGVMGEFAVLGTLYVLAPGAETTTLVEAVRDSVVAADRGPDAAAETAVRAGVTALPNDAGAVVRALGHRADPVTGTLHDAWDSARTELLGVGAPADRRQ
jgi:urease accessory protein